MPLDEPSWWYGPENARLVRLLAPLERLYGHLATRRLRKVQPYRSRLPVICVGNFTAGGTGKTPLSLHLAARLSAMGERPVFLTRGYGGRHTGPHWVDPERDTARDVGDEPLLLARAAPTLISRDRRAGAIAIETAVDAGSVIIMDDGLQNPSLAKDLTFALIDARRGLGNGHVIPAGPLRAPLDVQLELTDAIVVNAPPVQKGSAPERADTAAGRLEAVRRTFPGPVLATRAQASGAITWIGERPLVAFAGIANPARFFALIEQCGGQIAERHSFKDHHAYSADDARRLMERARALGATLVTTEKDHVRLASGKQEAKGGEELGELARLAMTLPIRIVADAGDGERIDALLAGVLATGGYRSGVVMR